MDTALSQYFSNTIQLCASDNSERKARGLLTFPKYPARGEVKAPKPVSSPVICKPLLLFWITDVRGHSLNITMSLQSGSPPQELRRKHVIRYNLEVSNLWIFKASIIKTSTPSSNTFESLTLEQNAKVSTKI